MNLGNKMETVVGIDLGTTNCTITAVDENGKITVIPNKNGEYLTPSAVYFCPDKKKKFLVGRDAKDMASSDPENLVLFVKREMGKDRDEVRFDKDLQKGRPYKFWNKLFTPEEISAIILKQLKQDAESYLGYEVNKAVITCPAYFGTREKEATRDAGEYAGLDVLEVIPEPTAAALSYVTVSSKTNENILIFDLGGGTFDVNVLKISNGINGFNVTSDTCGGDRKLGGKDWDDALMTFMDDEFESEQGISLYLRKDDDAKLALGNLRLDVERAKVNLFKDNVNEVQLSLSYGGVSIARKISRDFFKSLTKEKTDLCKDYCEKTLQEAGMIWADIDTVLCVGSMSNCTFIQDELRVWCGKNINFGLINPKTCVSEGAAIWAHKLIGGNSVKALVNKPKYDSFEKNEELVAQAKKLEENGKRVEVKIDMATNVLPASIGIIASTKAGEKIVKKFLMRNENYPKEKSFPFKVRNTDKIEVKVVEGESDNPQNCDSLGTLIVNLDGRLQLEEKVEVTLGIDNNGILKASAINHEHNIQVETEIRRPGKLTKKEKEEASEYMEDLYLD